MRVECAVVEGSLVHAADLVFVNELYSVSDKVVAVVLNFHS